METTAFTREKSGIFVRNPEGCWSFVPNELPPELAVNWPLAKEISEADRSLSELAGVARTLPNPHLLIGPFSRREAVLSSRIEGTVASLSDLLSYEAVGTVKPDRSDVLEVANYVTALEYGLSRVQSLPVSLRLLRELHARLMKGVRGDTLTPGEFRKRQNWIGPPGCKIQDATFVPPPVPEMQAALNAFETYIHADSVLPPLVRMAIMHYQFEAIHPFLDGNGRIGRLLITLLLVTEGLLPQPLLYLSAFFEKHRDEYYRLLLEVSRRGAWTEWITFFLRGVAEQSSDALLRAKRLQELASQYRQQLLSSRSSASLLQLSEHLFVKPVITVQQGMALLGVSQPSAQNHVDRLVSAGILKEITGRQRGRVYLAHKIVNIVEEDSAEQLSLLPNG